MITLTSIEPLFAETASIPKDTIKKQVVQDFRHKNLVGVLDNKLEIRFDPEEGGDILIKVIDQHAATGYLVFQDENTYRDWLNAQLYEPTQGEIAEAANHG